MAFAPCLFPLGQNCIMEQSDRYGFCAMKSGFMAQDLRLAVFNYFTPPR